MSRRSDPPALPTRRRVVDGTLHVGTDPWADCSLCGTVRDPAECLSCPTCAAMAAGAERAHHDDLRHWALETFPITSPIQ